MYGKSYGFSQKRTQFKFIVWFCDFFSSRSLRRVRKEVVRPHDALRLLKQPRGGTRSAVRSADYMAQTLRLLQERVHHVLKHSLNVTGQTCGTKQKEHLCQGIICLGIQHSTQFIVFSLYCLFSHGIVLRPWVLLLSLKEGQLRRIVVASLWQSTSRHEIVYCSGT